MSQFVAILFLALAGSCAFAHKGSLDAEPTCSDLLAIAEQHLASRATQDAWVFTHRWTRPPGARTIARRERETEASLRKDRVRFTKLTPEQQALGGYRTDLSDAVHRGVFSPAAVPYTGALYRIESLDDVTVRLAADPRSPFWQHPYAPTTLSEFGNLGLSLFVDPTPRFTGADGAYWASSRSVTVSDTAGYDAIMHERQHALYDLVEMEYRIAADFAVGRNLLGSKEGLNILQPDQAAQVRSMVRRGFPSAAVDEWLAVEAQLIQLIRDGIAVRHEIITSLHSYRLRVLVRELAARSRQIHLEASERALMLETLAQELWLSYDPGSRSYRSRLEVAETYARNWENAEGPNEDSSRIRELAANVREIRAHR